METIKPRVDLHIINPEYGAGTTFNWDQDKYGIRGMGIATFRMKNKESMNIESLGSVYKLEMKDVREFMKDHPDSNFNARGILLRVVPLSIMKLLWTSKEVLIKQLKDSIEVTEVQPTLF